jgi:hypothetical protein
MRFLTGRNDQNLKNNVKSRHNLASGERVLKRINEGDRGPACSEGFGM